IMITDFVTGPLETERRGLGGIGDIVGLGAPSEGGVGGRVEEADAVMMYHTVAVTKKKIERPERGKVIVRRGVGYDNVDWRLARQHGIAVANVPDYGTEEVADSAIGMLLALTRGINLFNSHLRAGQGEWLYKWGAPIWRLRGRVLGIVGLGRIG